MTQQIRKVHLASVFTSKTSLVAIISDSQVNKNLTVVPRPGFFHPVLVAQKPVLTIFTNAE